jgi:diguanylate cyclase (GGDEF)-like protein/PAS domain S-box-containing protein
MIIQDVSGQAALAELQALRARVAELEARLGAYPDLEAALRENTARFRGAFDYAAIGMALVAPDGRWLEVNQALCDLVGYSAAELCATSFQAITHPEDLEKDLANVQQMLEGAAASYQMEKRYIHKRGQIIWALLCVSLVRDPAGQPLYFISQIQDITPRKHMEDELREREAMFRLLMAHSLDAVLLTTPDGAILAANSAATEMFGYSEEELRAGGRDLVVDPDDQRLGQLLAERIHTGVFRGELNHRRRDGTVFPAEVASALFRDRNGDMRTSMIVRDISERKRVEAARRQLELERESLISELHHQATTDGLTQLLNRRAWMDRAERAAAAAQSSGCPLTVILLDADHFKRVNDTYGHAAGDAVLQAIAARCARALRSSDLIGRYGGEEFVIFLPETGAAAAWKIAERVRATVAAEPVGLPHGELATTVSLGVVTAEGADVDLSAMLSRADQALYSAKQAGRNCVRAL